MLPVGIGLLNILQGLLTYKQILKYLLNNYKQRKQLDLPKMHGQTTSSDVEARELTNKHSTVTKCGCTCFYISSEHDDVSEF